MRLTDSAQLARAVGDFAPTAQQRAVIEAPLEPSLVVAGAGSGKTATMAARVVYLVANGIVRPDQILGLTFTRKAAGELAARIRARLAATSQALDLPRADGEVTVATYDSFAGSLVRDHALRVGADPDAALITKSGAWQVMNQVVESWTGPLELDYSPDTVTSRCMALAAEMTANLRTPADVRAGYADILTELRRERGGTHLKALQTLAAQFESKDALLDLVERFVERKRELGVMEYADQAALACRIARAVPAVGQQLRGQYTVVLLDEFQDTSVAQLQLLADLFGPGHAVTAVGDPNQAIYGFRGASADSLPGFVGAFGVSPQAVRTLSTSWRNDTRILRVANRISSPLRTPAPRPDTPAAPAAPAAGAAVPPAAPAAARVTPAAGVAVHVPELTGRPDAAPGTVDLQVETTPELEAAGIARWLRQHWQPGRTGAVLVRARYQFTEVIRALERAGLPAEVTGLTGLLFTPEVVDLRAALTVALDASRGDAMMRLLTNDRLGLTDLQALHQFARRLARADATPDAPTDDLASLVEAVDRAERTQVPGLSAPAARRVAQLAARIRRIRAVLHQPLADAVVSAERILNLDIEAAARPGVDPVAARANLDAFADHAQSYQSGMVEPTLAGFLQWLEAAESQEGGLDIAEVEPSTQKIQVLTVHAAKGLEWDAVAVAGLTETVFPSYDARSTKDKGWLAPDGGLPYPLRGDHASLPEFDTTADTWRDLQAAVEDFSVRNFARGIAEERRLAYVAVTRARSALLLSSCWTPKGIVQEPSRFLEVVTDLTDTPASLRRTPRPDAVERRDETFPGYPLAVDPRRREAARQVAAAAAAPLADVLAGPLGARERQLAETARLLLALDGAPTAQARLPRTLRASAAHELVTDPEAYAVQLRRPMPERPLVATQAGSAFHEWVEQFYSRPAHLFPDDPFFVDDDAGPAPDLEKLQEQFAASPWAAMTPLHVEFDVSAQIAGFTVRARLDAVFQDADGIAIVDWKTGRPPADAAQRAERELQLELYRVAYSHTQGVPLERIRAALFYVAAGQTLWVAGLTEAQVAARLAAGMPAALQAAPEAD